MDLLCKLKWHSRILILGFTFKENCPVIRNTRVVDIVSTLEDYNINVTIYDPNVSDSDIDKNQNINLLNKKPIGKYDAIILAVAHDSFINFNIKQMLNHDAIVYDVKNVINDVLVDGSL